jgi:hypothetical protein
MKKLLLSIAVALIAVVSFAQEREDSLYEKFFTYENFKTLTKNMDGNANDSILQELLKKTDNEDLPAEEAKSLALKIVSLNARSAYRLTTLSRERFPENKNPAFDKMVNNYFTLVERTCKEKPLLAMMNPANKIALATISKTSFFDLLDWLANFKGCAVFCCEKIDYPHFRWFLLGGKKGTAIQMMRKIEPALWMDNLICGFDIYKFPINYPIKKAKITNVLLWMLNGLSSPAFNDNSVFISRIPVYMLTGFNINMPCDQSQNWVLPKVKVKGS